MLIIFCRLLDIGVADVMEAYLGAAHFLHNFLEVDVQRFESHEAPVPS